jgi:hypothetical protein
VLAGADDNTLVVQTNGDVSVAGALMQGSSRNIKKNIDPVDERAVLEKVRRLDIKRWQYKRDETGAKHMGPMAEEFFAAFGLGTDDAHLAASDVAAVALASIRALGKELEAARAENAALKKRLDRIEARMR